MFKSSLSHSFVQNFGIGCKQCITLSSLASNHFECMVYNKLGHFLGSILIVNVDRSCLSVCLPADSFKIISNWSCISEIKSANFHLLLNQFIDLVLCCSWRHSILDSFILQLLILCPFGSYLLWAVSPNISNQYNFVDILKGVYILQSNFNSFISPSA